MAAFELVVYLFAGSLLLLLHFGQCLAAQIFASSPLHRQITIFCSTSPNNCLSLLIVIIIIIIIIIITVEPPCTTTSLKRPLTLHIWDGITGIIIIMQYKTKECELQGLTQRSLRGGGLKGTKLLQKTNFVMECQKSKIQKLITIHNDKIRDSKIQLRNISK